jgi:hypothetical protein
MTASWRCFCIGGLALCLSCGGRSTAAIDDEPATRGADAAGLADRSEMLPAEAMSDASSDLVIDGSLLPDADQDRSVPDAGQDRSVPDGGREGFAPDAPPSEFCSGDAKIAIGDRVIPVVSVGADEEGMACCIGVKIRFLVPLEAGPGYKADISFFPGLRSGTFEVPPASADASVEIELLSVSEIGLQEYARPSNATITVHETSADSTSVGICLTAIRGAGATLRLYTPAVPVRKFSVAPPRFAIYPVAEPGLSTTDAMQRPLSELPLGQKAVFADHWLSSYSASTHTLRGDWPIALPMPSAGLESPFVVVADGEPIYLGSFVRLISSYVPPVPCLSESLQPSMAFTIGLFANVPDPRSDERIFRVLREQKLLAP